MKFFVILVLWLCLAQSTSGWDTEEMEIFDLVEEINKDFYEFMHISKNATSVEVKRAFRGLSIVLHPDKNPAEDANIQFRNLVSIYEVLKEPSKREKYNKVLRDGLPNWKSALYYYRRMRKIGLYEGSLIIFIIITIGQYIFAWAAYLEKKYTAEQVIGTKLKKLQKKNKTIDMETILNEIPTPSLLNTLPFQIPLAVWNIPKTIKSGFSKANELKEIALEKRRLELEELQRQEEIEREQEEQVRLRKEQKENLRRRKQIARAPERTDADLRGYAQIQARELTEDDAVKPVTQKTMLSGGFWSDEDLIELIRLVKKYPGGSSSRWSTIAEAMNRTVQEVTFMAAKMKENGYRIPGQSDSVSENAAHMSHEAVLRREKVKKTADSNKILILETNWSQEQQQALEAAIVKHRKTDSGDRWQKIANCVPDKTKEECLVRYKYLCEVVKSQKMAELAETRRLSASGEGSADTTAHQEYRTRTMLSAKSALNVPEDDNDAEVEALKGSKKRSKRKERRRRRDISSGDDSDDVYQYERH